MSNVLKPLAPKISKKTSEPLVSSTTNNTKRRKAFHPTLGYAIPPPIPAKVARRNARERNRVKQVIFQKKRNLYMESGDITRPH